jgi:hypothetical protein
MSYFGGLGAGKGWLKFQFVVEPQVLRDAVVAVDPVFVKTNCRVPADYTCTPLEEYIANYERYVDAMIETPDAASQQSSLIYVSLGASLRKFGSRPCDDANFKVMNPEDPVVNAGPAMLAYNHVRKQLRSDILSNLCFGVELSYPRFVSLEREEYRILHDTAGFQGRAIFDALKSQIQKVTRPCTIRSPAREHRTQIRITDQMRALMRRHPGLKAAGLGVI